VFTRPSTRMSAIRWAPKFLAVLLLAGVPTPTGCDSRTPPAPAHTAAPADPGHTYTVRGIIVELPDGRPQSAFRLRHEAIDDFVDGSGRTVGMGAMIMEFALDPTVSVAGLAKGDVVTLTFTVWWKGQAPARYPDYRVTKVERLPADTPLEFRAARPPTTPGPAQSRPAPGSP